MKNILIAGAGHGGLVAAIRFAKEGYRVRLYEKRRREELGYDWHDAVPRGLFEGAGLPEPPEGTFLPPERMAYFSTAKKIKLYPDVEPTFAMIDRKVLIEYLLSLAEKNGVELFFEREILAAAVECDGARSEYLKPDACTGYTWTERGIYRHGEKIMFHLILRNGRMTAPKPFPPIWSWTRRVWILRCAVPCPRGSGSKRS